MRTQHRIAIFVLRGLFVLLASGLALYIAQDVEVPADQAFWVLMGSLALAAVVVFTETFFSRANIRTVSAVVFGTLLGMVTANLFVSLIAFMGELQGPESRTALKYVRLAVTLMLCYLGIALILRTQDEFKFILPYVEFKREVQGPTTMLIDTSVLIDGRWPAVCQTGLVTGPCWVPNFVVRELHQLADSSDDQKRARGRRGLQVLKELQEQQAVEVRLIPKDVPGEGVDQKLVELGQRLEARIVTTDANLSDVAFLKGVPVINLREVGRALATRAMPGDQRRIKITKAGKEKGQGVGYLADGTMVVVEEASKRQGEEVEVEITSDYHSPAGRMLFGRLVERRQKAEAKS